jgi:hypothetical protein
MNGSHEIPEPGKPLRSLSPGYYPPTDEEYRRGWEAGVLAIDASVLLSLYRYSTETRDELLNLLRSFADRLWLPHQAALEYERNRLGVIRQGLAAYDQTLDTFNKHITAIGAEFSKLSRHPLLDQNELSRMTTDYAERIIEVVETTRPRHPTGGLTRDELLADPTRMAVEAIFDGRAGRAYTDDEYSAAVAEARARLTAQRPPGYLDKDKPEPDRYGDYLFWRQAVDRARHLRVPLIVLTDDEKEDWWWHFHGMTLGHEFFEMSQGERLLMYTTRRFIEEANRLAEAQPPVSAEAVGEVERIAAERTAEYEIRTTECPFCRAEVTFRIGSDRSHTALPRCEECGQRFHAFHAQDDSIGTRKPGEGAALRERTYINCSACGVGFQTTLPTRGRTKSRACFQCGALLTIDDRGGVTDEGPAQVFTIEAHEHDCPGCGAGLRFVYQTGGEQRTSCPDCAALVVKPQAERP